SGSSCRGCLYRHTANTFATTALLQTRPTSVRRLPGSDSWCSMRQGAARGLLRIAPVGEPAIVQSAHGKVEHAGFHGGSRITPVPKPLTSGTIDHITAERECFERPGHHPIDPVQKIVGRCELTRAVVGGSNEVPSYAGNCRRGIDSG